MYLTRLASLDGRRRTKRPRWPPLPFGTNVKVAAAEGGPYDPTSQLPLSPWSYLMRHILVAGFLVSALVPATVFAQGGSDPDKNVKDGGVLVKGWTGRTDKSTQELSSAKFAPMGGGFHVTSGPPAIYWSPENKASGSYTVKASFTQTKAPAHPEAYGVFMGGTKLDTDGQNYLYCVVFGNGMYSVKHRYGSEVHTLVERKASDAINKADASGKATNEVGFTVTDDKVSCVINGTAVESFDKSDVLGDGKLESTDGMYGIRVNHNLDVHVAGFAMTKN